MSAARAAKPETYSDVSGFALIERTEELPFPPRPMHAFPQNRGVLYDGRLPNGSRPFFGAVRAIKQGRPKTPLNRD